MLDINPKAMPALPFSGLRVLALEQAVAAPFCTRQLADLGADVIKIERPDGGDFAREYDHVMRGESAYFAWLNRGKRSLALDIKTPQGKEVMTKLLARSDVFVHNLSPGTVERLGYGFEALNTRHPRLIWCGISGYGPSGPYRDKKAYDMLVQAEAGVTSLTGSPEEQAKVGISIADIAAGLYAYSSILATLYQRERSGAGQRIDISMFECLTEWMMPPLYVWLGSQNIPARAGMRHNMVVPYGSYACSDGEVMFAIQNEREWQRFCTEILKQPDLPLDTRYSSNHQRLMHRVALEKLIEDRFRKFTARELIEMLDRSGIANAAVNDTAAVAAHAQLAARQRWVDVETPSGPIPALLPPHNLAGSPALMGRVPALGEHTEEILAELE